MAAVAIGSPGPSWRDRFYTIEGQRLPSVTTILDIIAKPALGPWYAKEERRYFETAMLEVLSRPGARDPEFVLAAVAEAVSGVKPRIARSRKRRPSARLSTPASSGSSGGNWARMPGQNPGSPRQPPGPWRAGRTGPGA